MKGKKGATGFGLDITENLKAFLVPGKCPRQDCRTDHNQELVREVDN